MVCASIALEKQAMGFRSFFVRIESHRGGREAVRRARRRSTCLQLEVLETRLLPSSATKPYLLGTTSPNPSQFVQVGGTTFFAAANELWSTNGTAAGTVLISGPSNPTYLTNVNGTLFLSAGGELWKSNGTAAGTVALPGPSNPTDLTNISGTLFFSTSGMNFISHGELWRSNGTASGTTVVQDIPDLKVYDPPYGLGPNLVARAPSDLTNVNGTLFFQIGPLGGLWRSNGTASGTSAIFSSNSTTAGSGWYLPSSYTNELTNVNGTLFFQGGGSVGRTDGTAAGTEDVVFLGGPTNIFDFHSQFTNVNGTLFFSANDVTHGVQLWESNGTAAGTSMLSDINVNPPGTGYSDPGNLTNVNGILFYTANDGTNGSQLWESNGSAAGTFMVADVNPPHGSNPSGLTNVNGTLFFSANDGTNGGQLWKSNGSTAGTVRVSNISPQGSVANVNGTLFFAADDGVHGSQPWVLSPSATTAISVSSTPNPSVYGQSVTMTATVAAGGGTPAGSVDFTLGSMDLTPGGVPLDNSGVATFTTSRLHGGTDVITANYFGNSPGGRGDDSMAPQVVTRVSTTTSDVSPSTAGSLTYGQVVTYSATVTSNVAGLGPPTGAVGFLDGATTLASATLNAGTATFTDPSLAAGTHTITAVYQGDINFSGSDDTGSTMPLAKTVVADGTSTTVTASDGGSAVIGETVTLTATVTHGSPGTLTPTGSVVFTTDGTPGSSISLDGSRRATTTLVIAPGTAGATHTVTAAYSNTDGNFTNSDSTGNPITVSVAKVTTTTAVTSSDHGTAVIGETVTFTATVSSAAPAMPAPPGSVVFTVDGTPGSSISLNASGQATTSLAIPPGAAGAQHTITAAYANSDGNFTNSDSTGAPFVESVTKDGTTTSDVTSSDPHAFFGESVDFTVTIVASPPGTVKPAGAVDFMEGTTTIGQALLNSGVATFLTASLPPGNQTITAVYRGNSDFAASNDTTSATPLVQSVKYLTKLGVSAGPSNPVSGQPVMFTAVVGNASAGASAVPTGAVQFAVDGVNVGPPVALDTNGKAVSPNDILNAAQSPHTVTATYSNSDGAFFGSVGALDEVIAQAGSHTSLSSSAGSSVFGAAQTFTAVVGVLAPGAGAPTGTVAFQEGMTVLAHGAVVQTGGAAQATFSTLALAVGSHTLTAVYAGDGNFASSVSTPLTRVVIQDGVHVGLISSQNPTPTGSAVQFISAVAALAPGSGIAAGMVVFQDVFNGATKTLGSSPLNSLGIASFNIASLATGGHTITARYGGDTRFNGGTSAAYALTVQQGVLTAHLSSSAIASVTGQAVTLTLVETAASGTPSGMVTFRDGGTVLAKTVLNSSGQATFSTSALTVGNHGLAAIYSGNASFAGNTTVIIQSVARAGTTIRVTSSATPGTLTQPLIFTATVGVAAPGFGRTTGTVLFDDGTTLLGSGAVDSSGHATFSTTALAGGRHSITAVYSGDSGFGPSTSTVLAQQINAPRPLATNIPVSSTPSNITAVGGTIYFTAGLNNHQLWETNGTVAGTALIRGDIGAPFSLTDVNGKLYFGVHLGEYSELWTSDGTYAGTILLVTLDGTIGDLTNANGRLFFENFSTEDLHPGVLYESNGTPVGTQPVVGDLGSISYLTNVNGTLFFQTANGSSGFELWKSNGSGAGTTPVTGNSGGPYRDLINVNGALFFEAGQKLFRTEGTAATTLQIASLGPDFPELTNVNGTLFFRTNDGVHGVELWKSNGTPAGTAIVSDINPGSQSSLPDNLVNVSGTLFFDANDGTHGAELWQSNGAAAGTVLVKDIFPGSGDSTPEYLTNVNGVLFFTAIDNGHGRELWRSNGSAAGTILVADIDPGTGGSFPKQLTNANGILFFAADDGVHGAQLWESNGSTAGTAPVKDINVGTLGLFRTSDMANVNGTLFFAADDVLTGVELWRSNGFAVGTSLVKDINTTVPANQYRSSSFPSSLTNVNGTLFFRADDGLHGPQLWTSNGSAAGTVMLGGLNPVSLTNVNGTLFFAANDGHGAELWKSNGTADGTVLAKDINPGPGGSYPFSLTNVDGTLFFDAVDGTHGPELWKSDGTAPGTTMVMDINAGSHGSSPNLLTNVSGTLFFVCNDGVHGVELWKTNGAAAGTVLVADINPGPGGSYPNDLTNVNGTLFFSATDAVHGSELWRSDGTSAGTVLVSDINAGSGGSYPSQLTNFSGTLFFAANDGAHGTELFESNGIGSVLVKDINPGSAGSSPADLTIVNGSLFFSANDGVHGDELWESNGSGAGTGLVMDFINPGTGSSTTNYLTNVNGTLFFAANDPVYENRPWVFGPVPPAQHAASALTIASTSSAEAPAPALLLQAAANLSPDASFGSYPRAPVQQNLFTRAEAMERALGEQLPLEHWPALGNGSSDSARHSPAAHVGKARPHPADDFWLSDFPSAQN
jgi:ELWxxDGT repeat protein